jgi:hypothetical protein
MSGYRVTRLLYRFVTDEPMDRFERPAPRSGKMGSWDYLLDGGVLHLSATEEFRDRQLARDDVEPLLRSWETAVELMTPPHRIRFEYDHSDIEELDPQPGFLNLYPEPAVLRVGTATADAMISRDNAEYPQPNHAFQRTDLVERLLARLRRVRAGAAELPAAGYYVLDAIEHEFGGGSDRRRNAAIALNVDVEVLRKLGELTSQADPEIGRKAGAMKRLTPDERTWIDAAIARLIQRAGEHPSGVALPPITMSDLPALP